VLAGVNGLLLVFMAADAKNYFANHDGGGRGVVLAVLLVGGGLAAGLVGGNIATEVPAPGPRRRRTAVARVAPVVSLVLFCAGGCLVVLFLGAS